MRKWTSFGLLFLVTAAVYSDRAATAVRADPAILKGNGGTSVIMDDPSAVPTTGPSTEPARAVTPHHDLTAEDVRVSKDEGTVEIHVNDANLVEVLRMLSLQSQTNILPSKEVRGTITANLYGVTIREALDAILNANGYAYQQKGNVIYVYTAKELLDQEKKDKKTTTDVFRLYYITAANAQVMIKPVLSESGQVAVTSPALAGIASDATTAGGNNVASEDTMVVTDYPENLEKVRNILKEIDRRPQQILVEATIVSATLNENNSLGVDFTLLGGVSFPGLLSNEGQSTTPVSDALTGNILNNPASAGVIKNGYNVAGTAFTQNVPQGGLRVGVVTNNVAMFLQALEETTDTVVLANPKVLVLNKQKGEVKVAREDAYRGQITIGESGVQTQAVDFEETGTKLLFRPYIADDGYIRLEIHPEDSVAVPGADTTLPPTKLTTETTTNIMVKDGRTILIGGMFRELTTTQKNQVPLLGNLPLAGPLFRSQSDTTTRSEVIILLTPHIIKDDAAYSAASEKEQKEIEKMRVGVRKGMMIIGRERLAETYYECALTEMNKPHPDQNKVIWDLNCATDLNPRFIEAIDLKQHVTGKTVTDSDNSSVRLFVVGQILNDKGSLPLNPPPGVPATQISTVTAKPTTMPAAHAVVLAVPATQPTTHPAQAMVAAPTTQPVVQGPTSRPIQAAVPTTQPVAQTPAPATQPTAVVPASQPAQSARTTIPGLKNTHVTDLSDDEADEPSDATGK